jgi:hypothetical protein
MAADISRVCVLFRGIWSTAGTACRLRILKFWSGMFVRHRGKAVIGGTESALIFVSEDWPDHFLEFLQPQVRDSRLQRCCRRILCQSKWHQNTTHHNNTQNATHLPAPTRNDIWTISSQSPAGKDIQGRTVDNLTPAVDGMKGTDRAVSPCL